MGRNFLYAKFHQAKKKSREKEWQRRIEHVLLANSCEIDDSSLSRRKVKNEKKDEQRNGVHFNAYRFSVIAFIGEWLTEIEKRPKKCQANGIDGLRMNRLYTSYVNV